MKKLVLLALAAALSLPSFGSIILDTTGTVTNLDPTQTGRLVRDGVPSIWGQVSPFPGLQAATGSRSYDLYTLNSFYTAGLTYWQIILNDAPSELFSVAYTNSFTTANLATNYLGDQGSSGDPFGNPGFFQVATNPGEQLVLVVHRVNVNAGSFSSSYGLLVEAFSDVNFTDIPPPSGGEVPEPATIALSAAGLALIVALRRGR